MTVAAIFVLSISITAYLPNFFQSSIKEVMMYQANKTVPLRTKIRPAPKSAERSGLTERGVSGTAGAAMGWGRASKSSAAGLSNSCSLGSGGRAGDAPFRNEDLQAGQFSVCLT